MALNQDQLQKVPLVSVGMPVFNGGKYIRQALDSLLTQDYPNIEFIISDNASTDYTAKICLEYAANDSRITFMQNNRNIGGEANFERVLELAAGEYFMWAAYDDLWDSTYISKCINMLQERRAAVLCCSSLRFIDKDGTIINQDYDGYDNPDLTNPSISERVKTLISRKGWYAIYGLIKSSILKEALRRVRKTRNKYGYDVILLLQLCLIGPFCKVPNVLFYYRQKGRSEKDRYNEAVLSSAGGNANIFLPYTSLACNIINTVLNAHLSNPIKEHIVLDLQTLFAYNQVWHYRFRQYTQVNSSNHIEKPVEYKRFIDTLPFEPRKLLPFVDHGPQKQCTMGLRCALIEFNAYHDEVIPTFIYLLNELGIAVDVFMSKAAISKGIFECTKNLNFSLCEIENSAFFFYEKAFQFCNYDFFIINSLEPKQWLQRTDSINIPIIGVIHNASLLTKDSDYEKFFLRENRLPIALAKHIPNSCSHFIKNINWISPVFLNDTLVAQSTQKTETVSFVVSGNLEPRRNYNSLLDATERLVSDGFTNFRMKLVGYNEWSWGKAFKQNVKERGLSAFFTYSVGKVDYKTYFSMVMDSDFILPLLDQTDSKYLPYFVDKCTASMNVSIGLGVVPILHKKLNEVYDISCGITYKDGELFHALKTAARWDGKSLDKCRSKLYEKGLSLLHESKNNFQKILKDLNVNIPCSDKNIECNRPMSLVIDLIKDDKKLQEANVLNEKGEKLFNKGDITGALTAFKKTIEIDPNFATAYNNLGVLYWQTGEAQKAINYFNKSLEIDPNNRDAILNCSEVLKSSGKIKDAKRLCSAYLQKEPNDKGISRFLSILEDRVKTKEIEKCTYYAKDYFDYQKNIGAFGGVANIFKFKEFIRDADNVIDFGCGGGYLLHNIQCKNKVGVEINEIACREARKNGIDVVKSVDDLPDRFADVIISNHALEHVYSPIDMLKALYSKLKPSGKIVFVVPHQGPHEKYISDDINKHLFTWNSLTLGNLFAEAGYEVIKVETIQHQWPPDYVELYNKVGKGEFHNICREYAIKNDNYQIRIIATTKKSGNALSGNKKQNKNTFEDCSSRTSKVREAKNDIPVILITYKRPWHTEKVLQALREHNVQRLHIFSDGPKANEDAIAVNETRQLFKKIDWTTPTIIEQNKNIGLAKSIVGAVNYVFTKYDRLILLEDDCVPQKYFFEFISQCLDKYKDDEKIFGISGYSVPVPESILKTYPYDLYSFPRIGSWGWATWKRAWQHFEPDLAKAYKKAMKNNIDLSQGGTDFPLMLNQMLTGKLRDVWTLHWVLSVYLNKGCYIYPTLSHIENIGMDGSGVHCGATQKFVTPMADKKPSRYPDNVKLNADIYKNFRKYYDVQKPTLKTNKISSSINPSLKIVHLCMQDFGGAGKAAYRLHKGLQAIGMDSTMLVLNKRSGDPSVKVLPDDYSTGMANCLDVSAYNSPVWNQQAVRWQKLILEYPERPAGLEMFTDAASDVRLDLVQEIQEADIINLHWVAGSLNCPSAPLAIGAKPIVWTLHDMNPFTGGCHYAGDCKKYIKGCGACPQLGSDTENDLAQQVWKQKYGAYKALNINIVTPSRWLGQCASESKLFSRFPVNVVPNGFPIDIFRPYPKEEVRKTLNIPESAKVILFGADSVVNERKGFRYLLEALNKLSLKNEHDIIILTFGNLPQGVKITSKYPIFNLGSIADENQLAMAYSVADVFVLPSLEDNLPNTVVEAMACGVPVVGFDIGGIPDMIEHKKTGYLVKPKDIAGLIEGINKIISSADNGGNFLKCCREKVEQKYALDVQAKAYKELYSRIFQDHSSWIENIQTKAKELNQQGEALFNKGDIEGALSAFTKAIEIAPNYATAHNNLGVLYWQTGEVQKAVDHFAKALETDPNDRATILNCGAVLTGCERTEDARKLYSSYLQTHPDDEEVSELLKALDKDRRTHDESMPCMDNDAPDAACRNLLQAQQIFPVSRKDTLSDPANWPLISIVTPSFNHGQFLEECIDSILSQNYPNLEYIIIDGGSTDNSVDIIKKYEKHLTYWQSKPDGGQYAAINEGFKKTTGEIMTWLNSDDKFHQSAFRIAASIFMHRKDVEWIMGRPNTLNEEGQLFWIKNFLPRWSREKYLKKEYKFIQQEGTFWRRSLWEKAGATLQTDLDLAGDLELWARFFRYSQLHSVDLMIAGYRYHPGQKAQLLRNEYIREAEEMLDREILLFKEGRNKELLPPPEPIVISEIREFISGSDLEGALDVFAGAFEVNPEFAGATEHNKLGVLYRQAGKVNKASEQFIKAMEIDPNDPGIILNCGEAFKSLKKNEDAAAVYTSYLERKPHDREIARALTELETEKRIAGRKVVEDIHEYLVSAIVSTYNSERFIRNCLEDLETQTIADRLEIIVVNSGSEQNEEAIVKEFQKKYSNIKYIRTDQRETVYAAWNRGVKASSGKYITNANTDDRRRTDACKRMVEALEGRPDIALVYANVIITENENETFNKCTPAGNYCWLDWNRRHLLEKGCFIGPQPMWRRSLHEEYGYFDDTLVTSGDYEFWLRVSQTNSFLHIRDMLGLYLKSPDGIEHSNRKRQAIENERILSMYRQAVADGSIIRRFYKADQ